MFGSSRKQVIFNPSMYGGSSRRNRRMPRWLITFLAGVITGSGGFWFLLTNYGPPRLSIEDANRLQTTISELNQEKNALQQQLSETQLKLDQTRDMVKQLQPVVTHTSAEVTSEVANNTPSTDTAVNNDPALNPITPIQESNTNLNMSELVKSLPIDPSNNPVGIRVGNFQGSMGQLSYELILTKSDINAANMPARVEIVTTGRYRNGNRGFDQLQSINITANEYVRLQGQVALSKPTLTPQSVEVKVINSQTRKVLGSRTFNVTPTEMPPTQATP